MAEARRVVVDSLGGGGDGGGGGKRGGSARVAACSEAENRVATDAFCPPRRRREHGRSAPRSPPRARRRLARRDDGARGGRVGQPIQTRPVRETAQATRRIGEATDTAPPRRLWGTTSPGDASEAVGRFADARGRARRVQPGSFVAVDANERGGADHRSGLATVSFADHRRSRRATRARSSFSSSTAAWASTSCAATCSSAGASTRTCATRTGTRRSSRRRTAPAASQLGLRRGADVNGQRESGVAFAARFDLTRRRWLPTPPPIKGRTKRKKPFVGL